MAERTDADRGLRAFVTAYLGALERADGDEPMLDALLSFVASSTNHRAAFRDAGGLDALDRLLRGRGHTERVCELVFATTDVGETHEGLVATLAAIASTATTAALARLRARPCIAPLVTAFDLEKLAAALDDGALVDGCGTCAACARMGPLSEACYASQDTSNDDYNYAEVVRLLVRYGADVDRPNADGSTPLYWASQEAREVLIAAGARRSSPPGRPTPLQKKARKLM